MCETIRKLYTGKLNPMSEQLKPDTEYYDFIKRMSELEDKAKEILSEEQQAFFTEYVELYNNYNCMMNEESFIQGYKLGAKITMETFK